MIYDEITKVNRGVRKMSAHVLDDENLNAILRGCKHYFRILNLNINAETFCLGFDKDLSRIGQILKEENYRSVNTRYDEETKPDAFKYKDSSPLYSVVQLLKLCDCYEYQSCESSDYVNTNACTIINRIRKNLIAHLPGYDDAHWGLE